MRRFILMAILGMMTHAGFAADVVELNVEIPKGSLRSPQSDANNEADPVAKHIEGLAWEQVQRFVPEDILKTQKTNIQRRILANRQSFVLSHRVEEVDAEKQQLVVRMSLENLRDLLFEEGFLYQQKGQSKILPLISFVNKIDGHRDEWWADSSTKARAPASEMNVNLSDFYSSLKREFLTRGFFVFDPISNGFAGRVPVPFRQQNLGTPDYMFLSNYFATPLLLTGQVKLDRVEGATDTYQLDFQISLIQGSNGKLIADVVRNVRTDSGPAEKVIAAAFQEARARIAKDLSEQTYDLWRRGILDSSSLMLTLKGALSPKQLSEFKEMVMNKLIDIKNLREFMFAPAGVTLQMESTKDPAKLAESFKSSKWGRFLVQVTDVGPDTLSLSVAAR